MEVAPLVSAVRVDRHERVLTLYLAANIVSFNKLAQRFAGGDVKAFLDVWAAQGFGNLVIAIVGLGLIVWLAHFLYKREIFLRV